MTGAQGGRGVRGARAAAGGSAPVCAVDLHTHTAASDGGDQPEELVAAAAAAGVATLAVTDHDTVAAVAEARAAGERLGVEVLAGCELTASVGDRVVHVLVYGEGLLEPDLAEAVEVARRGRHERNLAIGERLAALTGVGYREAVEAAGASALSRAHFARALVARGAVADVAEAFDRYLSSGRPAYVPAPSISATGAVAVAAKAGGVAVLAHPGRLAPAERDRVLGEALEAGIAGVEVWHSQHDPDLRRSLARLVERRGLLATGGSDYHGRHKANVRVGTGVDGNVAVPAELLDALRDRLAPGPGPLTAPGGVEPAAAQAPSGEPTGNGSARSRSRRL
jgi:3',5'-nucleoside bisphosphate phosphatase